MPVNQTFKKYSSPALWIFLCVAAVALRYLKPFPLDWLSDDIYYWVLPWVSRIRENGMDIYAKAFTNYSPAYTYLLGLVSLLPRELWLTGIKTVSIVFDIVMAVAAYGIATSITAREIRRPHVGWIAAAVVLWLPTTWINSTVWGQCDAIWVAMCLMSLWCFLKDKPLWGMIFFGLGVSVKLQAAFFGPVVLLMLMRHRARWWQLLIVPGVYVLTCVPCAIVGRSWESLLGVYFTQYQFYPEWTSNSASICYFLRPFPFNSMLAAGIVIAAAAVTVWITLMVGRTCSLLSRGVEDKIVVMFAAFCAVAVPWMLPKMHERYMFMGDVATAICAVCFLSRRWVWTAVLVQLASMINIVWFLLEYGHKIFDGPTVRFTNVPPLIMATVAIYLMVKIYIALRNDPSRLCSK